LKDNSKECNKTDILSEPIIIIVVPTVRKHPVALEHEENV
jgi:hypothetical protein